MVIWYTLDNIVYNLRIQTSYFLLVECLVPVEYTVVFGVCNIFYSYYCIIKKLQLALTEHALYNSAQDGFIVIYLYNNATWSLFSLYF